MQRCTPSMVQSCSPATPSAQPSHTPLVSTSTRVLRVGPVGPGHLDHVAVVVGLLLADPVGTQADPTPEGRQPVSCSRPAHQRARGCRCCSRRRRRAPAHEPGQGEPARRAVSTASADGALTATTALKPAAHAFCTISKPARPLTYRPRSVAGSVAVEQQPADHLVDRVVAPDVLADDDGRAGGGRRRRRRGRRRWLRTGPARARMPLGHRRRAVASGHGDATGSGARRSRSSSIAVEPHSPHDDVAVASARRRRGRPAPVSTVTTLNSVSTAIPSRSSGTPDAARRRAGRRVAEARRPARSRGRACAWWWRPAGRRGGSRAAPRR